jgi:two-component sensor histidine kinase
MNVKVSYTTKFDDVPYDCWRLLDYKIHDALEFLEPLKELQKMLANSDNFNSLEALEKIHKLRLILANYDQCLDDIQVILTGWTKINLQQNEQRGILPEAQQEEQKVDYAQMLHQLKNKLQSVESLTKQQDENQTD